MVAAICSVVMIGNTDVIAQQIKDKCGNDVMTQKMLDRDPAFKDKFDAYVKASIERADAYEQLTQKSAQKTTANVIIPVVFHIILTQAQIDQIGGTQGLYDRASKQLGVLNTDFNARNSDSAGIPAVFKPLFGNANISFAVAHRKPDGTGTTGLDIRVAPVGFGGFAPLDGASKHYSTGGLDSWDNSRYLNIWVVNLTGGTVLGFGYSPDYAANLGVPQETGVVITYGTFGKKTGSAPEYYISGADKGRTLVHELGHFFNLWHVWGNTQVGSGNCTDDDGVGDTPQQKDANQSCPSFPKTNCANTNGGEMFMNYMDYPGDACVRMFSKAQVTRMQADIAPTGPSYQLTTHPELLQWPTGISGVEQMNAFEVYPNPTTGSFNISIGQSASELRSINVTNYLGQTVKIVDADNSNNKTYSVDITNMPKGVYTVQCRFDEGVVTRKVVLQ